MAEHAYQVEDLIRRGVYDLDRWIALGPSAMAALERLGVEYEIPDDFYSDEEFQEFCDGTHKQVEFLCDRLDQRLLEHHEELKTLGMPPFRFHIFPLLMIFDAVRGRAFQLRKIFQAYPESTVRIHNGENDRPESFGLLFTNEETLWGHVATLPGWKAQIEILLEPTTVVAKVGSKRDLLGFVKKHVLKSLLLTTAARLLSLRDYRGLVRLIDNNREALLFVNAPYEWTHVLSRLEDDGRRILFVSEHLFECKIDRDIAEVPQGSFEQIESDPELMNCFGFEGIDFYPLLRDRLSSVWSDSPAEFERVARQVGQLMRRYKVRAVLRCSSASGIDHAINQSARVLGIPVLAWQHGAVSYDERITQFHDYADSMTADYTLVYGREVAKAYTNYGRQFSAKVVPVGAPSLDRMSSGNHSEQRSKPILESSGRRHRILYASTNYMQNHWYSGWSPAYSERRVFQDQSVIASRLRMLLEKDSVEVIVKLHPSDQYQEPPWLSEFAGVKNTRIVKDEAPLPELLRRAEAVVLDFPSTTLLQAIATGLPVFVLTRHLRYPRETEAMLGRRACVADDAGVLMNGLQAFLESGVYPANLEDMLFLEGYGTHLNDGKSGERAVEIVSNVTGRGLHDQILS